MIKAITFNQLQLRLLTFLFVLFTTSVFSYRYYIELPKLEQSITKLSERELNILSFNISDKLDALSRINFDYAVWTSSYDFMRSKDKSYIEENIVVNTFVSLKIDGIFYLDEHLKPVLAKGYHRSQLSEITFSFYDFEKQANNLKLLPSPTTQHGAPKTVGFINTRHGPAMFSATQVRDSDMNGQHRGFLIMVQLLEKEFVEGLSKSTLTEITYQSIPTEKVLSRLRNWNDKSSNVEVKPYSDMLLRDVAGTAIIVLRLKHSVGRIPSLINEQSFIFVGLMSLFIYLVYRLVSITIIKPVKKLAADIKERDHSRRYCPLDSQYDVSELATVSQNVNDLMLMVQLQKDKLLKQANSDQLTKILNRRGLMSAMEVHKDLPD